jgi:hypothetical protein
MQAQAHFSTIQNRDPQLWQLAQTRASFKMNAIVYSLVNAFLVLIWYLTGRGYCWPIWPIIGWGLGMAIHGFRAYGWTDTHRVEREYQKLQRSSPLLTRSIQSR